jgi:hypothetical protein
MKNKKILLGLTTTPRSDWREKIKEMVTFDIKEVALFPTALKSKNRKELYDLLEEIGLKSIPHVHARGQDMGPEELEYLIKKFKTEIFNLHSSSDFKNQPEYQNSYDYGILKNKIYLENTIFNPTVAELDEYAGLCIDFSHWENFKLDPALKKFDDELENLAKKYKVGCAHISSVIKNPRPKSSELDTLTFTDHFLNDFSDLDYIKKYSEYFPDIISIELENSFEEQLKVKGYLEKIING